LFNVLHTSLQIVAVSESTKTHVMHTMRMHSKRIHVLGNSIEDKPILDKQVCRERLKVDENTFVFGFVGRLVPIKQVDIILNACAIIKSEISFVCLIGGSGPEEASLKTLAHNLGVADRCLFLGVINDVHGFISACDVLLMSSRSESAGMVIIEAFRAGVPVISNHIEGPAEIIGRNGGGITYQPCSAEQLAKAMLQLMRDVSLREKLGREGRQNFEAYYRIEDYARKLRALYVTF
jgi:glycosyltransferase involved in cell wall biosynthesis